MSTKTDKAVRLARKFERTQKEYLEYLDTLTVNELYEVVGRLVPDEAKQ